MKYNTYIKHNEPDVSVLTWIQPRTAGRCLEVSSLWSSINVETTASLSSVSLIWRSRKDKHIRNTSNKHVEMHFRLRLHCMQKWGCQVTRLDFFVVVWTLKLYPDLISFSDYIFQNASVNHQGRFNVTDNTLEWHLSQLSAYGRQPSESQRAKI